MGPDVENGAAAVAGLAAGLGGDERDRVGFVQQPQFALWKVGGRRIEKDPALEQRAVKVGLGPIGEAT